MLAYRQARYFRCCEVEGATLECIRDTWRRGTGYDMKIGCDLLVLTIRESGLEMRG